MRITFVLPYASLAGGIRVVATYAKVLSELGHDVTVVSRPKPQGGFFKRLLKKHLKSPPQPLKRHPTPLLDFLGDKHLVLDRARPVRARDVPDADVIIATWWDTAAGVAALPPEKGRGFYLIQDYELFHYLPAKEVAATYPLPLEKIAVSSYIRDQIVENSGPHDIAIVPNAVDTIFFDSPPRSKNTPLRVGFLCNTNPRKRVELAVDAVTRARAKLPDLQVTAFGARVPSDRVVLPDWIDFRLTPPQADIPDIYASCDLWLFTSSSEGFGLPLLEAMACRTPVLATRAGAAPDLIDGHNGQLLEGDAEAFAQAIVRFSEMSDTQWQGYSNAAYDTAHAYTWQDAAHRLIDVLNKS